MATKIKKIGMCLFSFMSITFPVFAGTDVQSSVLFTGTQNLLNSITTALIVIAPLVAIALTIYFAIRRSGADEMDQKMWGKRIANAWICAAIAVAGSGLVTLVMSYYTG